MGFSTTMKAAASAVTAGVLLLSGLVMMPAATAATGGGAAGGSGGSAANLQQVLYVADSATDALAGHPVQGWGQDSTNYAWNQITSYTGGSFVSGSYGKDTVDSTCQTAINQAVARTTGAKTARVVGLMVWYAPNFYNGQHSLGTTGIEYGRADFGDQWATAKSGLAGYESDEVQAVYDEFQAQFNKVGSTVSVVCVALNDLEPDSGYTLDVTTTASSTFSLAGSTGAVQDTIHASSTPTTRDTVSADVTLHWDGVESNAAQVTKSVNISTSGDTKTPNFTPSDFGWTAWPSGKFWFDVKVAAQGGLTTSVDTPNRDPRETWTAEIPSPEKYLTSGDPADTLSDREVLASGMSYNAVITANSAGYSTMSITDTIQTDQVYIGSTTADDPSAVYVLNPDRDKVNGAKVTINRDTDGQVTVSATISDIPSKYTGSDYMLVVPTYVLPTGEDYTITDDSKACYGTSGDTCVTGNSATTRKVTPTPDKVWVLDEEGALVASDPDQTNQAGADNKVFLMGDAVSAVVNGSIPANLAENLTQYVIADDWTDASQYVDFSDASQVKVYYEDSKDSGTYTDVTNQFTISIDGTVTTATANEAFLSQTAGQCKSALSSADKCRTVKLVISGQFRDDYDTDGETVRLTNAGWEQWNNETIATNEPPVYTWTPNPNKQVLGSNEEDGDNAYENINGLSVFAGQKLEYSVGIDLNIPSNTARGVTSLAVQDVYDVNFTPDKSSVEIWDSRDATNPKAIAAKNYTLTWDESGHSFTVTFTDEWVAANLGEGSEWLTQGWLTLRFTGTVNDDVAAGTTVENQAFEIINGAKTATEIPTVTIPTVTPDKEDLNTDLIDIDGKTVVKGDTIVYRLTLDASISADKLAYYVHKLGMIDDYDEAYLNVSASDVAVTNKATGEDVTSKFNIQVANGKLYVFARQVDSTNNAGELISGDPQPTDLAAYAAADIVPGTTPIIDQSLLGNTYYITFRAKVTKQTDGYVIKNQALQNIENSTFLTKVVSNPLKNIQPDKDVVASEATNSESLTGKEIELNSVFNYRLNSSSIPANRAYKASQWSIADTFDKVHDQYTGTWAAYANEDIYNGDTLVYAKGDLLQDSAKHEAETATNLFDVTFDEDSYTFTIAATDAFLDLINTRTDLSQSFSVYTQMIRIAPSDKVENVATETYNNVKRDTNVVWTSTPENPAIDVEKWDVESGKDDGDRDTAEDAIEVTDEDAVKIGFTITNTGDVPLANITLTDETTAGTGTMEDISCETPLGSLTLDVGTSVECTGTLTGLTADTTHTDNVTATGESIYTGARVSDADPWNATVVDGSGSGGLAHTGASVVGMFITGIVLVGGGALLAIRRRTTD